MNPTTPARRGLRLGAAAALAALVLALGHADIARGGETLGPVLLVLGYCVLVPLAILRAGPGGGPSRPGTSNQ